jgi:uncharacterized protein with PIN domain
VKSARLRFYAELNDFLPPARRYRTFEVEFHVSPAVRDLIESQGVPHTEVDLVLVNGEPAPLNRVVEDGALVSVYPVFESLDIAGVSPVRPEPLRQPRFVLDVHLGRLARYLRMAGFDAKYANDASDPELARVSAGESRILLTRDVGLLKRAAVTRGYWVRETRPARQLQEIVQRFELKRLLKPFSRCMECNTGLEPAPKERAPEQARARHTEFRECPACGRVYWPGSHYARMRGIIERLEQAVP